MCIAKTRKIRYICFFIATLFPLYPKVLITLILYFPFLGERKSKYGVLPMKSAPVQHIVVITMRCARRARGMALNKAARFSTGSMGFPDLTASCKCRTTQTPGMLCQRRQHSLVQSMSRLSDDSPAKQKKKKSCQTVISVHFPDMQMSRIAVFK